jgi:methylenetetrahydrofolate reductase (NADPH)
MTFKDALKSRDFVLTAQLNLTEARDRESLLRQGEILRPVVDAVQLTDGQHAHMSGLAAAALLLQQGIDPVLHMNCRDRNRIAMQKDVIGAAVLGVTSILVTRGAKISNSKKLGARNVFDTPALEVMAYIQGLMHEENTPLASDFRLGANAELFDPGSNWRPKNLTSKSDAGANFIQLQLCFDLDAVRSYMARIVAAKLTHRVNFIMALSPLPSANVALWVRDNVKGALVPDAVVKRLLKASDPEREGIEICAELLRELATIPGVSGANLLSLGDLATIPAAIDAAGMRPSPGAVQ